MEEEQRKKKTIIVTTVTMALLVLIVGISYALWQQTRVQEGTNYIASGCFGVQFEGNNPINLANSFPITTEDGMKTTPYTFTITNTCNGKAAYDVNLESLSNTTFQNTSIRVALDDTNKLYSEYTEAEKYYDTSIESRRLISGRLEANESVTYNLRIWIDEAVTIEEQNKTFASKIVVNASEDFDEPEITDINATSTINSISITYQANGDISNTCKWGIDSGTYDNTVSDATNTNCDITGLSENTTYYYQICTETGKGSKCVDGNIKTILTPSLSDITATSTTTGITLTYTASGDDITTTCKYGTSTSYGSTASSVTNSKCSITGLTKNTAYYYQVCTTSSYGEVCKDGNINTVNPISDYIKIGDYISMTPMATSFKPGASITGYYNSERQNTINPSELNLWRVISLNEDGTIDMVSDKISSEGVYFYGGDGYMKLVGGLNTIAAQYTDGKHVERTRHIGYSNQIERCTSYSSLTCPSDTGYQTDLQLVNVAYGGTASCKTNCIGLKSFVSGTERVGNYWLASRKTDGYYTGRFVSLAGSLKDDGNFGLRNSEGSETYVVYSIRPIVTLKSATQISSGSGTASSPYTLK